MKRTLLFIGLLTIGLLSKGQTDYARFVNPFIGTGSVDSLSLSGSNFPGATFPFGMVQLSPDTDDQPEDPCSGYDYADRLIVGFSHTHLSGTGVADLFDFLFMPYGGSIKWDARDDTMGNEGYSSKFSHQNEEASPGYYQVLLNDDHINAEFTVTEHSGMHRYKFPENKPYHLIIDLDHSLDKRRPYWSCKIIGAQLRFVDNQTIEGYRIITGWARLRKVYFRAEFSRPFDSYAVKEGNLVYTNVPVANHTKLKTVLNFDQNNNQPLVIKVGISSVSYEGARQNLKAEISGFNFDQVVQQAKTEWNKELSVIDMDGTPEQKQIFYTSLYHTFIHPNTISDVNGDYINQNFEICSNPNQQYYSTFSLWDTYRAAHPLFTLTQPERSAGFINSLLDQYKEYGYLPIWQLWGSETYCMIGNHAIPVIVDAYFKEIKGINYQLAYEAIRASSTTSHPNSPFEIWDRYGYFPENLQTQSVSITLEIAYNDWCVAQMAKAMGKTEDYEFFSKRAKNYNNLFDTNIGFFRAKDNKGEWIEPFSPLKYGGNGGYPFTEGNAWQYLWYVPHDVYSFIDLMGGKQAFANKLDEFFTLKALPEDVNGNASGFIGQYAHGNEPSHHIVYLYDFVNQPWKTQQYAAQVMNEQYTTQPSGYSGNEDCGQMSAWYIFSSMGFYPVNPANGIYCLGSPQLKHVVIKLEDGKKFEVITKNASKENCYIQKMELNHQPYLKTYITHRDILTGGTLEFTMGPKPNKKMAIYQTPLSVGE